jgi:hypothetical protein
VTGPNIQRASLVRYDQELDARSYSEWASSWMHSSTGADATQQNFRRVLTEHIDQQYASNVSFLQYWYKLI